MIIQRRVIFLIHRNLNTHHPSTPSHYPVILNLTVLPIQSRNAAAWAWHDSASTATNFQQLNIAIISAEHCLDAIVWRFWRRRTWIWGGLMRWDLINIFELCCKGYLPDRPEVCFIGHKSLSNIALIKTLTNSKKYHSILWGYFKSFHHLKSSLATLLKTKMAPKVKTGIALLKAQFYCNYKYDIFVLYVSHTPM